MKYDIKPYDNEKVKGFYVWNKPTFFVKKMIIDMMNMFNTKRNMVSVLMKCGI